MKYHHYRSNRKRSQIIRCAVLVLTALAGVVEAESASRVDELAIPWQALSAQELAQWRGGFTGPGNVSIDIGFDKAVLVDGQVEYLTRLNLTALGSAGVSAEADHRMLDNPGLQSGTLPENLQVSQFTNRMNTYTLIQNTMNDRVIQSITNLDVRLRNVGDLSAASRESMIRTSLINSLR